MYFDVSPKVIALRATPGCASWSEHVYPNERRYFDEAEKLGPWKPYPIVEELKPKARAGGPVESVPAAVPRWCGLTNLEYAPLCEIMGRSHLAPEVFNCSAPDTGNMEMLDALRQRRSRRSIGWSRCSQARSAPASR